MVVEIIYAMVFAYRECPVFERRSGAGCIDVRLSEARAVSGLRAQTGA